MNTQNSYLASKPHYEILDGLRGVAAVMVVIFHLFEAHAGGNHLEQIINHGYLAVDFFFMLSGFVIGYAYDDRWNRMSTVTFFKRRIIRLHPMVIVGSIVGAVFFFFQESPCFPPIQNTNHFWMNGLYEACCILFVFPVIVSMGAGGKITGKRSTKMCKFLGDISYPVYITHYPLIYTYTAWVCNNNATLAEGIPYMILTFAGSFILAYACLKLYDEPIRSWLTNRFLKGKRKEAKC